MTRRDIFGMLVLSIAAPFLCSNIRAESQKVLTARDSLGDLKDESKDAQQFLTAFKYPASTFQVLLEAPTEKERGKGYAQLVRFPSPIPSGEATNDLVSMEWHAAKDESGRVKRAPAIVVIHESGSAMPAGRAVARGLATRGWHAFLIHLPYYGVRRPPGVRLDRPSDPGKSVAENLRRDVSKLIETMRQGIADVRRARDAVAVLPEVDDRHIALQGTSLGGFVAAPAASLDRGYSSVYIMLAGGNLYDMMQNGRQDTEKVRKRLEEAGISGDTLRKLLAMVEPTRVAHRLDPATTWMYNAMQDDVVPIENARSLAKSARLDPSHQIEVLGGHYTAVVWLPSILDHVSKQMKTLTATRSG